MADWIVRQERTQGEATRFVRVPLTDAGDPDFDAVADELLDPLMLPERVRRRLTPFVRLRQEWQWIAYQPEVGATKIEHARVRLGSPLDQLRRLAESLSDRFGWSSYDSVAFALCGTAPRPLGFIVSRTKGHGATATAERIVIEAAPWLRPKFVATLFARERREHGAPRLLSEKQGTLAVFAYSQNNGETWGHALGLWNQLMKPAWHYVGLLAERQFQKDARDAFRRVTGEKLAWKRGRGERVARATGSAPLRPAERRRARTSPQTR